MLFNLALDPFLAAFERALDFGSKGMVCACDDDVVLSLSGLAHTCQLHPIYSAAERLAGVGLKTCTRKLIPCVKTIRRVLDGISSWVFQNIPDLREFEITGAAELLVHVLAHLWALTSGSKACASSQEGVYDIKYAGVALALSVYSYKSRILSMLGYVAQLVPLPDLFAFDQRVAHHNVYHAPLILLPTRISSSGQMWDLLFWHAL